MTFPARLRRNIVCQQAVELVTGHLEGTLARTGRRFEAHLFDCRTAPSTSLRCARRSS